MNKLPIILAADRRYLMPLATTLRSITEANRSLWPLEFHIFYDNFGPENQRKILDSLPEGSALIDWIAVGETLFENFSIENAHVSKMAYARLLIPKLFPETVTKVLYLDVDLLVLENLETLWATNLDGSVLGVVSDFYAHDIYLEEGCDPKLSRSLHPLQKDLPPVDDYFNSGVLLINLKRWREERISEKAFAYLKRFPKAPFMDQDALNAVCRDRSTKLDARWNVQDHGRRKIDPATTGILHFISRKKPWIAASRDRNARLFDSFRSRTKFARTRREKINDSVVRLKTGVRNVLKRGLRKSLP